MLVGRDAEREAIDRLVSDARAGCGGCRLIVGGDGVGKSGLLRSAERIEGDVEVLRANGARSESTLAFAGLHQLLTPLLSELSSPGEPALIALARAFGIVEGAEIDRFLTGAGALALLSRVARRRPLLCIVDDAEWLDVESAQALGFVARRLEREPIALLVAARTVPEPLLGLPRIATGPLSPRDSAALLRTAVPWRLNGRVAAQVVAETGGRPAALMSLIRALTPAQITSGLMLPPAVEHDAPVAFLAKPDASTADLLLVAAADSTGDAEWLSRARARLGVAAAALGPARDAGVLSVGERVAFGDVHTRSAIYHRASPAARRAAHRVLSLVGDPDDDRSAFHLAHATLSPDDEVARRLARAAESAERDDRPAHAAILGERAVALSGDPVERGRRALAAARASRVAGCPRDAAMLLATAHAATDDPRHRARITLQEAETAFALTRGASAARGLAVAARAMLALDEEEGREACRAAVAAAVSADIETPAEIDDGARPRGSTTTPSASDRLFDCLATARALDGGGSRSALRAAIDACVERPPETRWLWLAGTSALERADHVGARRLIGVGLTRARRTGALLDLLMLLGAHGVLQALDGQRDAAHGTVREIGAVAHACGVRPVAAPAMMLAALGDDELGLSELVRSAAGENRRADVAAALATAVLHSGRGRYDEAASILSPLLDRGDCPALAAAELVEAASRSGGVEVAVIALERLLEVTGGSGTDWARGLQARCRAVVEGDAAEPAYREALGRLTRSAPRLELARTHLLFGEWLRRRRRRVEARAHLRTARHLFMVAGVEGFAARAERELLATGERVRRRRDETRDDLTARESQIAGLASRGLSNPDIGRQLFISPRTVEYHLRKVYPKLGIGSRGELADALSDWGDTGELTDANGRRLPQGVRIGGEVIS